MVWPDLRMDGQISGQTLRRNKVPVKVSSVTPKMFNLYNRPNGPASLEKPGDAKQHLQKRDLQTPHTRPRCTRAVCFWGLGQIWTASTESGDSVENQKNPKTTEVTRTCQKRHEQGKKEKRRMEEETEMQQLTVWVLQWGGEGHASISHCFLKQHLFDTFSLLYFPITVSSVWAGCVCLVLCWTHCVQDSARTERDSYRHSNVRRWRNKNLKP